jgi:hypothetical protein
MSMRKRICDGGAAGVFEDLPALLVVLIALGIFIASIFFSTTNYIETWEHNERYEECLELLEALENYDEILVKGKTTGQPMPGLFSVWELNEMSTTEMRSDILSDRKYYVAITSLRNSTLSWSFGNDAVPEDMEKTTMYTIVAIEVNQNEVHTGQLRVTIW